MGCTFSAVGRKHWLGFLSDLDQPTMVMNFISMKRPRQTDAAWFSVQHAHGSLVRTRMVTVPTQGGQNES